MSIIPDEGQPPLCLDRRRRGAGDRPARQGVNGFRGLRERRHQTQGDHSAVGSEHQDIIRTQVPGENAAKYDWFYCVL